MQDSYAFVTLSTGLVGPPSCSLGALSLEEILRSNPFDGACLFPFLGIGGG
jgi:hypothetical protein